MRATGTCSVCGRDGRLKSSNGTLYNHATPERVTWGRRPVCAGSGLPPVDDAARRIDQWLDESEREVGGTVEIDGVWFKFCTQPLCGNRTRLDHWNKKRAQTAGWFFQHNGDAWCPDHIPGWVEGWRARSAARG